MDQFDLGKAVIQLSQPVTAGSNASIIWVYTAGQPIDDSGYVKIVFRGEVDLGKPQFDEPAALNYCTVSTNGNCRIIPRWDPKGHARPFDHALFLQVKDGFLDSGETISLNFGDTSGGSPGWQMPSFRLNTVEFKTFVDPIATYQFKELLESPTLSVIPGRAVRAVCIAPSQVICNQAFTYYLKLEDSWGNPTAHPQKIAHPGWDKPGVQTLTVKDVQTGFTAQSNPIDVLSKTPSKGRWWADFHGQSEETAGSNTIDEYFTFACEYGLLDIVSHQGNDFQLTDAFWDKINQVTSKFNQPGHFVTFPGYEWSGNTPLGGDRNVFFSSEGGKITRSSTELVPGDTIYKNSSTANDLFENLAKQENPFPFVFAHVGGRYADMKYHNPDIELAVEVHSDWGTFEWIVDDALQLGHRVGICANSDGHKCQPGASYPGPGEFGSLGGLTCVLANELNRERVLEALKARHFYATTGNRSLVDVNLVTGDGRSAMMGDIIDRGEGVPELFVRVVGTNSIDNVEVRNGLEVIDVIRPYEPHNLGRRVKIIWSGAKVRGRDRKVKWDGELHVQDNEIVDVVPINFWNQNQPLKKVDNQHITWKSATTGGLAGLIITLAKVGGGSLAVNTLQNNFSCELDSVGFEPRIWDCGGLKKRISLYRLPDEQGLREFSFSLPIAQLHPGDNPIYIRMAQEDGHMAWSSPVYLV